MCHISQHRGPLRDLIVRAWRVTIVWGWFSTLLDLQSDIPEVFNLR